MKDLDSARGGPFRFFLWRRAAERAALNGYLPEVLASDGERVRRVALGSRVLMAQEFDEQEVARGVRRMVEARAQVRENLRGYAMFSEAEGLVIWRAPSGSGAGWVALPFDELSSGLVMRAVLPDATQAASVSKLCGGVRFRWSSGELVMDAAIEQRRAGADLGGVDLLDALLDWQVETTVMRHGKAKAVRLARGAGPLNSPRRASPERVEASWAVDLRAYQSLKARPTLKVWFVLRFGAELFSIPQPWDTWWLQVERPELVAI